MMKILSQPYPRDNNPGKGIRTALISGLIVFLFLWIFRPFNIDSAPVDNINIFILGYGVVTVLTVYLFLFLPFFFRNYFIEEHWTVGRNIFYFLMIVLTIGIGNLFYTHFSTGLPLSVQRFIAFELYALAVGFFVAAAGTLINYFRKLKLNEAEAMVIDQEVHAIRKPDAGRELMIRSENEKENLKIPDTALYFIESADNYSKVCYLKDRKITIVILRTSLKKIEDQLQHPFIFRCHRSFIVNLMHVESVSGNSQGYRLHFANFSQTVPVARRTGTELHKRLNQLKRKIS